MMRLFACFLLVLLAACATPAVRQVRYTGTLTPETACGTAGRATLTVMDGVAKFAANDGALVVPGTVAPDGKLAGQLVLTGSDKKPYPLTLEGTVTDDVATGDYVTPRCRFALLLTRVRSGLFGGPE